MKGRAMTLRQLAFDLEVVPEPEYRGWWLTKSGRVKTYHKDPESRDANEYLIETLATLLHMPRSHLVIVKGVQSRFKRVKIGKDITLEQLLEILEVKKE